MSPAIDAAFASGLDVSALHNHFFYDNPKVYFMHIGGHAAPDALAAGVKATWEAIREVRKKAPKPAASFGGTPPRAGGKLDAEGLGKIIGEKPTVQDGVVAPVPAVDSYGKPTDFSRSASLRGAREIVLTGQGAYDPILHSAHLGILNSPQTWRAAFEFLGDRNKGKDD